MQIGSTDCVRACSSVRLERTPDKREVDGSNPSRPTIFRAVFSGGVAQLGERLPCTQEAIGSNPFTSTIQKSEVRRQRTDCYELIYTFKGRFKGINQDVKPELEKHDL